MYTYIHMIMPQSSLWSCARIYKTYHIWEFKLIQFLHKSPDTLVLTHVLNLKTPT